MTKSLNPWFSQFAFVPFKDNYRVALLGSKFDGSSGYLSNCRHTGGCNEHRVYDVFVPAEVLSAAMTSDKVSLVDPRMSLIGLSWVRMPLVHL